MLEATLIIGGAYLVGSIPSAYLVVRGLKGIDIRDYGSGNAGATNVMLHVGWWTGLLLGAFDSLVKGTLPVAIAKIFDQSLGVQAAAGLVAIAGHNWSPFLRFTGGRGVATAVGVVLGFWLLWEYLILTVVIGLIGRLLYKETGLWTLVALVLLPVMTLIFDRPLEIVLTSVFIGLMLLAKRLIANWERPTSTHPMPRVLMYRLLWDRDVPEKARWTTRDPQGTSIHD
jgi:glycerol-3-phosphate acyltransferase PlsY